MQLLSYIDIRFYLFLAYFISTVIVAFFIPGFLIFSRYRLNILQKIVISTSYGMVMWAFQALILSYLHLGWLTYVYILSCLIFFVFLFHKRKVHKTRLRKYISSLFIFLQKNKATVSIMLLGTLTHYSSVWMMGIRTQKGLEFCCRSVPDNLFHLSMTQSLLQSFPPQEPGMAGQVVHNYYYASHLIIADLVRIFNLPLIATQANFMPLFLSVMFGLSIIVFSQIHKLPKTFTFFSLFFLYFHSDIFYLVSFYRTSVWKMSANILDSGMGLVTVPPLAFGIIFFFCIIFLMHLWIERNDFFSGILLSVAVALLVSIKIYIAIFVFIGFFIVSIYHSLKQRNYRLLVPFLISCIIALCLYLPVNSSSGGLFFSGFWRVTDFAVQPEIGLIKVVLALQVYDLHNNILHGSFLRLCMLLLYLVTMFGSLCIGFFQTKKSLKIFPKWLHLFFLPASVTVLLLSLFTLQRTGGANTVQFIIFLFYIISLYAALTASWLISRLPKLLSFVFVLLLMFLSLPQIFSNVAINFSPFAQKEKVIVSNNMLSALEKIRSGASENDLIAVDFDYLDNNYYFIPLLTNKRIYLTGTGILADHGVPYEARFKLIKTSPAFTESLLRQENISYIITKHNSGSPLSFSRKAIYSNNEVDIYKLKD
ncbi:MAG TPA: hypothetical protein VM077_01870 [Candidatus Limnocylindrales bacterium]|nr:hypothetical protein [Candidatus Limnocylindrales bacterium]